MLVAGIGRIQPCGEKGPDEAPLVPVLIAGIGRIENRQGCPDEAVNRSGAGTPSGMRIRWQVAAPLDGGFHAEKGGRAATGGSNPRPVGARRSDADTQQTAPEQTA